MGSSPPLAVFKFFNNTVQVIAVIEYSSVMSRKFAALLPLVLALLVSDISICSKLLDTAHYELLIHKM